MATQCTATAQDKSGEKINERRKDKKKRRQEERKGNRNPAIPKRESCHTIHAGNAPAMGIRSCPRSRDLSAPVPANNRRESHHLSLCSSQGQDRDKYPASWFVFGSWGTHLECRGKRRGFLGLSLLRGLLSFLFPLGAVLLIVWGSSSSCHPAS